jgi:hypothetical protein
MGSDFPLREEQRHAGFAYRCHLLEAGVRKLASQCGEAGRRLSGIQSLWRKWYPA